MIGFTGPYSDVNFGDYAMLVNNFVAVGADAATVFAYDRTFLEKIVDEYFGDKDVRIVDVRINSGAFTGERDYRYLTPIEVLEAVENLEEVRSAVATLDTLYVNGGGYLNSLWARPHRIERLVKILVPALVAAREGIEVVFTANGYGPFRGDLEFFASLFSALPAARYGSRDDLMSPFWLNQAGIPAGRVTQLPDDLLFIDETLIPSKRPIINDKYVLLETYHSLEYVRSHLDEIRAASNKMWSQHGLKIVFVPFHLGHGGVDQGLLLANELENFELFDIAERGFLPIGDAVNLVENAELVVSNRYHAVILALGRGVPFVSVLKDVLGDQQYYYSKNAGALENVVRGAAYDVNDYFFSDFATALTAVSLDLRGIVDRQCRTFHASSPSNLTRLRSARHDYLKGAFHG